MRDKNTYRQTEAYISHWKKTFVKKEDNTKEWKQDSKPC